MVANNRYLIRGGTVVDSLGVRKQDILIEDDSIVQVGTSLSSTLGDATIDATGLVVCPAFVDLHSHLREPGSPSETIISGSNAGVLGGYSALVAMPNTTPSIDSPEMVRYVQMLSKGASLDVYVAGAITRGRAGKTLVDMFEMSRLGVKIFTDDGTGVQDAQLMRRALEYAKGIDVTLAQHCEELSLSNGGSINEGAVSSLLGIAGIPNAAEDVMVARDIELLRLTGARIHFLHISTERSVKLIEMAKSEGLDLTAEVTPHHLVLSDDQLRNFNPIFKVNPPLRSNGDRNALWDALKNGSFDAIATDHAPHLASAKEGTLDKASFGMLGLQTAFGAVFGDYVSRQNIGNSKSSLELGLSDEQLFQLVAMFTWKPARIARIDETHGGPVLAGSKGNIVIFDPHQRYRLSENEIVSMSKNSPYFDTDLQGKILYTFVNGELKVREGALCR